jgi:hypothetical protein
MVALFVVIAIMHRDIHVNKARDVSVKEVHDGRWNGMQEFGSALSVSGLLESLWSSCGRLPKSEQFSGSNSLSIVSDASGFSVASGSLWGVKFRMVLMHISALFLDSSLIGFSNLVKCGGSVCVKDYSNMVWDGTSTEEGIQKERIYYLASSDKTSCLRLLFCTFFDITSSSSHGGAIYFVMEASVNNRGLVNLADCQFVRCSASTNVGACLFAVALEHFFFRCCVNDCRSDFGQFIASNLRFGTPTCDFVESTVYNCDATKIKSTSGKKKKMEEKKLRFFY